MRKIIITLAIAIMFTSCSSEDNCDMIVLDIKQDYQERLEVFVNSFDPSVYTTPEIAQGAFDNFVNALSKERDSKILESGCK